MMDNLKPCPICGAKAELKQTLVETSHEWIEDAFWIQCENGHHVNDRKYVVLDKEKAIRDWNGLDGGSIGGKVD